MTLQHELAVTLAWSDASGTARFTDFTRNFEIGAAHTDVLLAASATQWLRGDNHRYNSGDLFLAAIASSHMLRFLEIASQTGLTVLTYDDVAEGSVHLAARGDGRVCGVTLHPRLTVRPGPRATPAEVIRVHARAQSLSVLERSVSFPVHVQPGPLTVAA